MRRIRTGGNALLLASLAAAGFEVVPAHGYHGYTPAKPKKRTYSVPAEVQQAAKLKAQEKRKRRQGRNLANAFGQHWGNPRATANPFEQAP